MHVRYLVQASRDYRVDLDSSLIVAHELLGSHSVASLSLSLRFALVKYQKILD